MKKMTKAEREAESERIMKVMSAELAENSGELNRKVAELTELIKQKLQQAAAAVESVELPGVKQSDAGLEVMDLAIATCKRLKADGRHEDARDVGKIAEAFREVYIGRLHAENEADRLSIEMERSMAHCQPGDLDWMQEMTRLVYDLANVALSGRDIILKNVGRALHLELDQRKTANAGRTNPRESKHFQYRIAVMLALEEKKSLTFAEANAICDELAKEHPDGPFPSEKTIYTWLPPRKKKDDRK